MAMDGGLLSLKWNNHRSTFFYVLSTVRRKESYCDATIACDGKFYPVHKLVLSTCSDYFEQMFERTNCKHPIIVLKDIRHEDLEALLNYMYVGEVNVLQTDLSGLIKAAECLRIKGLAVPDEAPSERESAQDGKRNMSWASDGPDAKRRRPEEVSPSTPRQSSALGDKSVRDAPLKSPLSYREPYREGPKPSDHVRVPSSPSPVPVPIPPSPDSNLPNTGISSVATESPPEASRPLTRDGGTPAQTDSDQGATNSVGDLGTSGESELVMDNPLVKEEPQEDYSEAEDTKESIKSADSSPNLSFSLQGDHTSSLPSEVSGTGYPQSLRPGANQPQTMEDLVAQVIPGASGIQGKSSWDSEQSLLRMPFESYSGNQARTSQMVTSRVVDHDQIRHRSSQYSHRSDYIDPQKIHSCTFCHKVFNCRQKLEAHLRTHTGEKPFACHFCPYRSAQKGNLQLHIRTHTGEEPFACTYCSYRTKNQSNLNTHIRNKHQVQFSDPPDTFLNL